MGLKTYSVFRGSSEYRFCVIHPTADFVRMGRVMNFCYVNEKQCGEVGEALDPSSVGDVASKPGVALPGPVALTTSSLPSLSDHPVL